MRNLLIQIISALVIGILLSGLAAQDLNIHRTIVSKEEQHSANSVTIGPGVTITGTGDLVLNTKTLAIKPAFIILHGGQLQVINGGKLVNDINNKISHPVPDNFEVKQNFPNPFNPTTQIKYTLPKANHVKIEIYNSAGQKVKTLFSEFQASGNHIVTWDGTDSAGKLLSNGIYFYSVTAGAHRVVRKMTLIK